MFVPFERCTDVLALGPGARVVLVCDDAVRAGTAARLLELAGMTCVAALEGGLLGWRAAGLPTVTSGERPTRLPTDPDQALHQPERRPGPLTLDEVRGHVEDPNRTRWIKLAAFLAHGKTACVDGRDSQSVIGAPGGDAGEFLLALGASEALGQHIGADVVPRLLQDWVESFGRFYLHSDVTALNAYIASMRADPEIPESALPSREAPPSAWRAFNAGPPTFIRDRVLRHLRDPKHIGCGHLRLTLQNPDAYGVRTELVLAFFESYFAARWQGVPELEFVALGGGHQEGGVLLLTVEGDLWPHTRIPMVPPAICGVQTFVHHPQVTAFLRRGAAHWLAAHPELPALRGRADDVERELTRLGDHQMGLTLARLAAGLPLFEVRFDADRRPTVIDRGVVPGAP